MSLIIKPVQNFSSKCMGALSRRYFSGSSRPSSLVGPAPSEPMLPGDSGYDCRVQSLRWAAEHTQSLQGSVFSHADLAKLKNIQSSKKTGCFLGELMNSIKEQNRELQKINATLHRLVEIVKTKNSL